MNEEHTNTVKLCKTLRGLEFLRGVADEHVEKLAKLAKFVAFPAGTIIFNECEPALPCYLIVEGRVVVEICGSAVGCTQIQTLGAGDLIGWSSLLGEAKLTASARAQTATRAIELSGRDVLTLCEHDPEFGFQLMRCTAFALAKRLTAARLQLIDLYRETTGKMGQRK